MVIFMALKLQKKMFKDTLKKMNTKLEDVVQYTLDIHGKSIVMNDLIGKQIKIDWSASPAPEFSGKFRGFRGAPKGAFLVASHHAGCRHRA